MSRKNPSLLQAVTETHRRRGPGIAKPPATPRPELAEGADPRRPFAGGPDRSRRSVLVEIEAITLGHRLRLELDRAKVAEIADSMAGLGLQSPILLAFDPDDPGRFLLIAGAHRLEAARGLGWTSIEAFVIDRTPEEQRLIEIDENYARAELTPLDRARFVTRREAL